VEAPNTTLKPSISLITEAEYASFDKGPLLGTVTPFKLRQADPGQREHKTPAVPIRFVTAQGIHPSANQKKYWMYKLST